MGPVLSASFLTYGLIAIGLLGAVTGTAAILSLGVLISASGAATVYVVTQRSHLRTAASTAAAAVRSTFDDHRLPALAATVMLVLLAVASLRPSTATDEVEYHWAAPVYWAAHHSTAYAPYKIVNGFAFQEALYAVAAVIGNSVTAHLLHLTSLLTVLLAAIAIAIRHGLRPSLLVGAILGIPVLVYQSPIAYNDLAMATMLFVAFAQLITMEPSRRRDLSVGILAAVAVGIKPIAALATPAFLLIVLLESRRLGRTAAETVTSLAIVVVPVVTSIGIGILRSEVLTHQLLAPSGTRIVHEGDPQLRTGEAGGRFPTLANMAALPITPLFLGIVGQSEPYGGRIGLTFLVAVPLLALAWKHVERGQRQLLGTCLVAAASAYVLVAPVFIKTRFNIFVWLLLATAACVLASALPRVKRYGRYFEWVFIGAVLVGMADGLHVVLRATQ